MRMSNFWLICQKFGIIYSQEKISLMQDKINMPNLFEYQNYRTYLHDYYNEQKATKRNFSYKKFSQDADISAPSFLFYVIEGKRNLTKSTVIKISNAIGFNKEEAEYFEYLVFFNQARTITEKTHYYSNLVEIRRPIDVGNVDKDRWEYYSSWYHSVIREVVTFFDFQDDFNRLGAFLVPPISAHDAKKSISLLERLGFIEKDPTGLYHQTQNLIKVQTSTVDAFVIERFQMEMLQVVLKAYDIVPVKDRLCISTTFSISAGSYDLFKMRLREIQNQLMEIARIDDKPGITYQLTMNFIPVSLSVKNEKIRL
jgi:uncharacterized protein (TIGR02147 family)